MLTVDQALAARIEAASAWRSVHYARARQRLQPISEYAELELCGAVALFCGAEMPVNRAIGLGLHGEVAPADLDTIEAFYEERRFPAHVDLCPLAGKDLTALLTTRGYTIDCFYNVLFCPLPALPPAALLAESVTVRRAIPGDAQLWIGATAQGFEETDTPSPEAFTVLAPNFYAENAVCFLAYVDGELAGGAGMYMHEGVVEFGGASTRLAFRRRGVQTALLAARLEAAHAAGCDAAIVLTEPGSNSERNLSRVGFRLAYTKVTLKKGAALVR